MDDTPVKGIKQKDGDVISIEAEEPRKRKVMPSLSDSGSGELGYSFSKSRSMSGSSSSNKRRVLWIFVAVFLLGQGGLAYYVVKKRKAKRAAEAAQITTGDQSGGGLYSRAKALAAKGKHLEALEMLAKVQLVSKDEDLLALASKLERKIRAAPQLEQAQRMVKSGNWRGANYHLDQVLVLVPGHKEALALLTQVKKHRTGAPAATHGTGTTPSPTPPDPTPPSGVTPPKVSVATRPGVKRPRRGKRGWRARPTPQAPAAAPAPRPAMLAITCRPAARIHIDGQLQGYTPREGLKLEAGTHVVTLSADGHRPHTERLTMIAGQTQNLRVTLEPVPVAAAPTPTPTPTPTPVAAPAPAPKPRPAAKPIPRLGLPKKVVVKAFKPDGSKSKLLRVVCLAVEKIVSKEVGESAAGTTRALQKHLYKVAGSSPDNKVTLYPRTMGYLIAQALVNNSRGVSGKLVQYYRNGRIASLSASNWRP